MKKYQKLRKNILAGLLAANMVAFTPMVMAASTQNKVPQVKEKSAYSYVVENAQKSNRQEIVDFRDYCDAVLYFEKELKKGSLKGLIDDFDYIIPEDLSYSYFGFHAVKDGEITSYIFDLSSSTIGKYALSHEYNMDLCEVVKSMQEGKLNKSNFNMVYKTTDLDRYLYNYSKDKVEEKIKSNESIQNYLNQGYQMYVLPRLSTPNIGFNLNEYKNNSKISIVDIYDSFITWEIGKLNGKYVMVARAKFDIVFVKDDKVVDFWYNSLQNFELIDNSGSIKSFIDNFKTPKQFINENNLKEIANNKDNGYNVYVSNIISDLFTNVTLDKVNNNEIGFNLNKQSLSKYNNESNLNSYNFLLGRLDDATYENYINGEMSK